MRKRTIRLLHRSEPKAQILVEILIGIVIVATVVILIAQMSVSGFRGTKVTGQQAVMVGLAQEGLEAVEAIQAADWNSIYTLTKSTEYYPKISSGAWTLTTTAGDKTVILDGVSYQRWVIIENVYRDGSDNIVTSSGTEDPSTQKVTVKVTASGQPDITYVKYFSRSRNTTVTQTNWSGGSGQGTNTTTGFDANYNTQFDSTDGNVDNTGTPGSLKLIQDTGE